MAEGGPGCQLTGASGSELDIGTSMSGSQLKDWRHLGCSGAWICVNGGGVMANRQGTQDLVC